MKLGAFKIMAAIIIIMGVIMFSMPLNAQEQQNVCKAANGATCYCNGGCAASATRCECTS